MRISAFIILISLTYSLWSQLPLEQLIDQRVLQIDSLIPASPQGEELIKKDGKRVSISFYKLRGQIAKLDVRFFDEDFRHFKTYYMNDGKLMLFKEHKIIGDEIARLEEAKSEQMSLSEIDRAGKTILDPNIYYFDNDKMVSSKSSSNKSRHDQLSKAILDEMIFYLQQFR